MIFRFEFLIKLILSAAPARDGGGDFMTMLRNSEGISEIIHHKGKMCGWRRASRRTGELLMIVREMVDYSVETFRAR